MVMLVHCPDDPFRTEAPLPRAVGALVANGSPHWRISLQELPELKESGLAYICAPFLGDSLQPKTGSYGGTTGSHALVGKNWGLNSPQDQLKSLLCLCHTQPFSLPSPAPLTTYSPHHTHSPINSGTHISIPDSNFWEG